MCCWRLVPTEHNRKRARSRHGFLGARDGGNGRCQHGLLRGTNRRQRQRNGESGAPRLHIANADFAAVLLHDAVADAETETGSFPNGLGRVKGIKDAVRVGNAGTVIGELDRQAIPGNLGSNRDFPGAPAS